MRTVYSWSSSVLFPRFAFCFHCLRAWKKLWVTTQILSAKLSLLVRQFLWLYLTLSITRRNVQTIVSRIQKEDTSGRSFSGVGKKSPRKTAKIRKFIFGPFFLAPWHHPFRQFTVSTGHVSFSYETSKDLIQ